MDGTSPSLEPGFYRYVRLRNGQIAWAPANSWSYHRQLAEDLGVDSHGTYVSVLSAGFFHVDETGQVSIPDKVPIIDSDNKINRSIGLSKEPWMESEWPDYPPDLNIILAKLERSGA